MLSVAYFPSPIMGARLLLKLGRRAGVLLEEMAQTKHFPVGQ